MLMLMLVPVLVEWKRFLRTQANGNHILTMQSRARNRPTETMRVGLAEVCCRHARISQAERLTAFRTSPLGKVSTAPTTMAVAMAATLRARLAGGGHGCGWLRRVQHTRGKADVLTLQRIAPQRKAAHFPTAQQQRGKPRSRDRISQQGLLRCVVYQVRQSQDKHHVHATYKRTQRIGSYLTLVCTYALCIHKNNNVTVLNKWPSLLVQGSDGDRSAPNGHSEKQEPSLLNNLHLLKMHKNETPKYSAGGSVD